MSQSLSASFLTDDVSEIQRQHELQFERLCRGDQPANVPTFASDVLGLSRDESCDVEAWLSEKLLHLRENIERYKDPVTWRPFALSLGRYDLHFASAVMGCPVFHKGDGPVWWTSLSKLGMRLEDFRSPDLDENAIFQEMLGISKFVVEATEGRVPVEIPYVSEPLVAAVDMFSEDFLACLAREPDLAGQVLDRISATILEMRRRFFEAVPGAPVYAHGFFSRMMPRGYTLLYGCTTQLISGEMYREHIRCRDRDLFTCHARGGCIHLCGTHTQHIDAWRDMPEVKSLQLNDAANDDLEEYWRNLRPDQFVILVPSERMTAESALEVTGGRRLVINMATEKRIPVR